MGTRERSTPVRVRDVLVSALPELETRLLEDAIRAHWNLLIGPELGRRSRPGRLHAGVLDVTVDNSPCLQEMTLRSAELLAVLRRRFTAVTSLRLALGAVSRMPIPPAPARQPEPRPTPSSEELRVIEAMATSMPDPILTGSLRRLLTKDLLARRSRDACGDSRLANREES